ncbi:hypothetical protein C3D71_08575 [Cronobacter sakazakii]|uniref:hypothetical protein n=1 Tax=Cronobacter sakazakii TaxID=28141 RepID=UPI000D33D7B5|nr:hypothetical protein [Cronobacter sakazakii]ELY3977887.1 hypothetical protein [Cronobacter sakazakii]PUE78422.1 hypothetical protein C3D71_08575 [Cronobacter sakazakii]
MNNINELTAKLEAIAQHAERGWQEAHEQEARAEAAEKRIAELEARTVTLPRPVCTYADHSYPAYSEKQVVDLLESLGINFETGGE